MITDGGSRSELVIFDGDDTLWASQELYEQAKQSIRGILEDVGYSGDAWAARLEEIDLARVPLLGWDKRRFPGSCVIAYQELASERGADADAEMTTHIRGFANAVFTSHAGVAEGAELVLSGLRKRFKLALLTQGDTEVQRQRIDASGLAPLFDSIHIVETKTERSFVSVIEHHRGSAARTWSVGNSLTSDVYPALSAGLNVIWLHGRGWAYDVAHEPDMSSDCHSAKSLFEAEAILMGADVVVPAR